MPKNTASPKIKSRKGERRKPLNEQEFRELIETGKTGKNDRRSWEERRRK